ncbi:MAG: hypothetical protein ACM34I_05670 [bacterium]
MLRHSGGQKVGKGTYWNIKEGTRVDIENEDVLPGNETTKFLRLPAAIMLIAGPLLGLLYVIALPFIAIGTVAVLGGGKLIGSLFRWLKSISTFGWKPTEAYLSGKKKRKKEKS